MSAGLRLGAFGALLVIVFTVAYVVGTHIAPQW